MDKLINNRSLVQHYEEMSQRLEASFVHVNDLLTINEYDDEADQEGFYVIPSVGNGVIGRYFSLRDMKNEMPNIIVRKTVYKKLCDADAMLKQKPEYCDCQIVVAYGYRNPKIQAALYDATFSKKKALFPDLPDDEICEIAHREIACPKVAGHPTGGAVDVIIYDLKKKKFLDFGTDLYALDTKQIYYDAYGISPEAKKNRKTLRKVMCAQGFAPYDGEWWHFCYGDAEWAFYCYQRANRKKQGDVEKKALYRQKEMSEISEVAYNDRIKKNVSVVDDRLRIRLAVQKNGHLTAETMKMLEKSGIVFVKNEMGYLAKSDNFPLEVMYVRDDDIPNLVDVGVADAGIVGEDIYREKSCKSKIKKYLGYGECCLALAVPQDSNIKILQDLEGKKIATYFRHLTSQFLRTQGINAKIIDIAGSVGIAPLINYADAIVDLVATGSSLKQNNLDVIFKMLDSQAIFIVNRNSEKNIAKRHIFERLEERIDSYLLAKQYKRVNIVVPRSRLKNVIDIITRDMEMRNSDASQALCMPMVFPCNVGMTVDRTDEPQLVQTVMTLSQIWDKIEKIKSAGAIHVMYYDIDGIMLNNKTHWR